jgi:hypothetical protein
MPKAACLRSKWGDGVYFKTSVNILGQKIDANNTSWKWRTKNGQTTTQKTDRVTVGDDP